MEKQLKIVRYFILGFGLVFFCVGAGIGYSTFTAVDGGADTANFVLPAVFMGIGLLDVLIIVIWTIVLKGKTKKEQWLYSNGQSIKCKLNAVEQNLMLNVNGRYPYVIVCQWQDEITGNIHLFKSKNIWFNPAGFIDDSKMLTVFYDPANMKSYVVDLSFLPSVV